MSNRSYKEVALIGGIGALIGMAVTNYILNDNNNNNVVKVNNKKNEKNIDKKYYFGVDIGGTTVSVILVNKKGKKLEISMKSIQDTSENGVLSLVIEMIQDLLSINTYSMSINDIAAIGVGSPGVNDLANGIILKASNFPNWNNFHITSMLSKVFNNIPVFLENDANAALLAEVWIGAGKGCDDVVMITLGTGIGGAVLSGGNLLHGSTGMAGEIGHAILVPSGRLNKGTGVRGIFEAYASAKSVGEIAMEEVSKFKDSTLNTLYNDGKKEITCKDVFDHAENGDLFATSIVQQTVEYLGIGCINVCRYYDPKIILLSGGMTLAGEQLLTMTTEAFLRHHWSIFKPTCEIKFATTGNEAGAIGAAYSAYLKVN